MSKKEYTEKEKDQFKAQKQADFKDLVETAKNGNPVSRASAKRELRRIERKNDAYNRKNNPAKYAEKLRERAKYYDEKAKDLKTIK